MPDPNTIWKPVSASSFQSLRESGSALSSSATGHSLKRSVGVSSEEKIFFISVCSDLARGM